MKWLSRGSVEVDEKLHRATGPRFSCRTGPTHRSSLALGSHRVMRWTSWLTSDRSAGLSRFRPDTGYEHGEEEERRMNPSSEKTTPSPADTERDSLPVRAGSDREGQQQLWD